MEDRISSLPDEIISHILSFLPTKLAATTSILSKRWHPLWLSVPTLNFNDKTSQNIESFLKFVSSALISRDITFPIQSFHLKCVNASKRRHSLDINAFFDAVAQRRIQNVRLDLTIRVNVPPSLFSCRTLVVLHLRNMKVNRLSKLDVDFPLLTTLHLSFILFERMDYLAVLLYGCPVLQELRTRCLGVRSRDKVVPHEVIMKDYPSLPKLPHLSRMIYWANLQVLRGELDSHCCSYPILYNLTYMEVIHKHRDLEEEREEWMYLLERLNYCPKLQNLTIIEDNENREEIVYNWREPASIPECLSTQLKTCLIKQFTYTECGLRFAEYILKNSKVLDTMSIKSASFINENDKYQMLTKLASEERASPTCKLLFD
ncbi:FBD-associated F-box protein At5g56370-like isoform X1 [Vicia villosa]|uniref:FBD-associated F-box protein At5g56370-like isoform X1 n=1 Tax=Vicia villosa TaxID=3911 RepID=UPI00273A8F7A|nr:FBD-associated F-box protein At5g56370-like isoform X1 [Vicia villosa]